MDLRLLNKPTAAFPWSQCFLLLFLFSSDPPDPIISSPSSKWIVGSEKAELVCNGRGYPESQDITWKWYRHHFFFSTAQTKTCSLTASGCHRDNYTLIHLTGWAALECVCRRIETSLCTYGSLGVTRQRAALEFKVGRLFSAPDSRREKSHGVELQNVKREKLGREIFFFFYYTREWMRDWRKNRRLMLST